MTIHIISDVRPCVLGPGPALPSVDENRPLFGALGKTTPTTPTPIVSSLLPQREEEEGGKQGKIPCRIHTESMPNPYQIQCWKKKTKNTYTQANPPPNHYHHHHHSLLPSLCGRVVPLVFLLEQNKRKRPLGRPAAPRACISGAPPEPHTK